MSENGPFGFDPDEFDRVIREGSEGLREAFDRIGKLVGATSAPGGWASIFEDLVRRPRPEPETTGKAGNGVWAIYTVDSDGAARVEQVFPTELDALRAHKDNFDPMRRVRFLPYGIAVGVLDVGILDADGPHEAPKHEAPKHEAPKHEAPDHDAQGPAE